MEYSVEVTYRQWMRVLLKLSDKIMNNGKKTKIVRSIIGRWNYNKLQMLLKYPRLYLAPKKEYTGNESIMIKGVIFMIDGRTVHGGLSDRLRGLFSVYEYAKQSGREFKIAWDYPFLLQDYLAPASFDWIVNRHSLPYDRKNVSVKFFNSYSALDNDETMYFKLLQTDKQLEYVYSNVTLHEERFAEYFKELFRPVPKLSASIDMCLKEIGGKYVSITFRFIGLLGDFKDTPIYGLLNEEEREIYINKALSAVRYIKTLHPEMEKILVTSDSGLFLKRLEGLPFVYVIPGTVVHMDRTVNNDYGLHAKSFLDLLLISRAEKCYSYGYGRMFKYTRFAKTAALIGGKQLIILKL